MSDLDELEHGCRHHEMFALAFRELVRAAAPGVIEALAARAPKAEIDAAEAAIVETARRLADRAYPKESA